MTDEATPMSPATSGKPPIAQLTGTASGATRACPGGGMRMGHSMRGFMKGMV